MNLREITRTAAAGITANPLRSALTILGMMIGVGSVIVLVAVGNGSKQEVQASIRSLGTNVLMVSAPGARGGPGSSASSSLTLTEADVEALGDDELAPHVKSASPVVRVSSATLVSGETSYQPSQMIGTDPAYLTASDYQVADGDSISEEEVHDRERVAVVGPTVVQNLGISVGSSVRINGIAFRIVGITASKGASGSTNQDDIVIAPYTAVQDALAGYGTISQITVQATDETGIDQAQAEVTDILNRRQDIDTSSSAVSSASSASGPAAGGVGGGGGRRRSASDGPASGSSSGFQVVNQGSILEASSSTTGVFTTLLGAVAAISLLVGGIGVMNIMLVSVTERTREIGIRKAVGARRGDILAQFLTEAVLVSMIGGLLGVIVGLLVSRIEIAGVQPDVVGSSVLLAFGASALCGLFFGTYPAGRAARLRPIEALRYE
ncbi:ABC transporter permease [Patulibacter brassicae]|uniref:ABC transporter permease n=1 Tax=Patulibacter brassicae TaxID=1705717 RepID=A0ABU4VH79_9ACTN|nr:ABC transporter permease [Patulibacter brassicae]MDX8151064.1 ABC transporter permease [Patulibacter brassicae]